MSVVGMMAVVVLMMVVALIVGGYGRRLACGLVLTVNPNWEQSSDVEDTVVSLWVS